MNEKDKKEFYEKIGSKIWVGAKKQEWKRELLLDIFECLENPQHKYYSNPKKYIKLLIKQNETNNY